MDAGSDCAPVAFHLQPRYGKITKVETRPVRNANRTSITLRCPPRFCMMHPGWKPPVLNVKPKELRPSFTPSTRDRQAKFFPQLPCGNYMLHTEHGHQTGNGYFKIPARKVGRDGKLGENRKCHKAAHH